MSEAEVGFVGLGETGHSVRPLGEQLGNQWLGQSILDRPGATLLPYLGSGVNTAGGDEAQAHPRRITGLGDGLCQRDVSRDSFTPLIFTSIHVGFPGKTGRIDNKLRFRLEKSSTKCPKIRIVNFAPGKGRERYLSVRKLVGKGLTDVAGSSQKKNHKVINQRHPEESMTLFDSC